MNRPTVTTVLWMVFAGMLPVLATAEEVKQPPNPIAEISLVPTRIDWLPAVDAERWVLTLAGPGDLFIRRQFEAGKTPSLSLFVSDEDRLPDGSYAWELRGVPRTDPGTREESTRARRTGEEITSKRLQGTGKLPERLLVLSGRFSIQAGSFVAAPEGTGVDTPETSLRNITAKDLVEGGKLVVQGKACIGDSCNGLADADYSVLKLKSAQPNLKFDDIGDPDAGRAGHDWGLLINPSGAPQFAIGDFETGLIPFSLAGGAPGNSLYVSSSGNVGIGTASPTQELTVKSRAANENVVELIRSTDSQVIMRLFQTTNGDGLMSLFNYTAGEAIRLTGSGGASWFSGTLGVNCNSPGGFDFGVKSGVTSSTACNTGTFSGLTAGNTTFTVSSSRTIKENLEPIRVPDILEKIAAVDVYTYDFIEGPKDKLGLMAEDFHQVFGRGSDKLLNGQEVEMALWLAVQELTARNRELAAQNSDLSGRLARLEALVGEPAAHP